MIKVLEQAIDKLKQLPEAKKAFQAYLRDAPLKDPLAVTAKERLAEIEEELARLAKRGDLRISSGQDPTIIYLDGALKDISPCTLTQLEPGKHTLLIKKEGFIDLEFTALISPSQLTEFNLPQLVPVMEQKIPPKAFFYTRDLGRFVGGLVWALRAAERHAGLLCPA